MTTQKINFSIKEALVKSWAMFKERPVYYGVLSLVIYIFNLFATNQKSNVALLLVLVIASLIWSYVWLSVSLSSVDNKYEKLSLGKIASHLPNFKEFLFFIGVGLVTILIVLGGFIMIIIPGLYFAVRLTFANLAYVDRKEGVNNSLRFSWNLVKNNFWITAAVMIITGIITAAGFAFFGIGIVVTYPIAMLTTAQLYRALTQANTHDQEIIVQPIEISQ